MEPKSEYAQQTRPSLHGSNSSNFQHKMENIFGYHVHVHPKLDTLCESDLVNLLMMLDGYVSHKVESLFEGRWSAAYIRFWTRKQAETAVKQIRGYNYVANMVLDTLMSYYKLESLKRIERQLPNYCTTIIVGESGICRRNARMSHATLLRDFSVFGDPLKIQTQKYDHAEISFSTFAEALAAYIANNRWEHINQFCPPSLYYWVKIEIKEKELGLFQRYLNLNSNPTHSDEESASETASSDSSEIIGETWSKLGNASGYLMASNTNVQPQNDEEISSDLVQHETYLPDVVRGVGAQADAKINIQNQATNVNGYSIKTELSLPTEHWQTCFNSDPYMPATASSTYQYEFHQNPYFNRTAVPICFPNPTPINHEVQNEFSQYFYNNLYPKQNLFASETNELEKLRNYYKQMENANFNFNNLTESNISFQTNVSESTLVKDDNVPPSLHSEQAQSRFDEYYIASSYQNKSRTTKKSPRSKQKGIDKKRRKEREF